MPARPWMNPRDHERFVELVAEFRALELARRAARKRQDEILVALRRDGAPLWMIAAGVGLDSSVISRRTRAHCVHPCTPRPDTQREGQRAEGP